LQPRAAAPAQPRPAANEAAGDTGGLFDALRQAADAEVARAIEALVREAPDRHLGRINALDFAAKSGLDAERTIAAFLHASRLGLFELSWNVLCPGCGGVLDAAASLRHVHQSQYACALCAAGYEPTLDEMVEVTFTVSPRVRRIAAHAPHELPALEYYRQMFWSSGIDVPDEHFADAIGGITLDMVELPPGGTLSLSMTLPAEFVIVFDPVTHSAQFIDVQGEPATVRQSLSVVYGKAQSAQPTRVLRPGPLRLMLDNRTDVRVLPGVYVAGQAMHDLLGKRRPFLTAKRLLTNQTFREIYRTSTLDVDQRLKITSLTFLFTDLKGSTDLYERVGDLVAFDIVNEHFRILQDIIAAESGAVVKTIGDAVMATFGTPDRAIAAALRIRAAMRRVEGRRHHEDLLVKIGIHEGPCLAVTLNDRQDYFGQTVNIAARVQALALTQSILATGPVVDYPQSSALLRGGGIQPLPRQAPLRGIAEAVAVYELP
jgi:class 3 adenylate cyclase